MSRWFLLFSILLCTVWSYSQTAKVQIIHNSPTPGTDAGPVVDIYINGTLLPQLTAVPFRAATPFLDVPAGVAIQVAVAVNPSTSVADAIATFDLGLLADGGTYVVVAGGVVGSMDNPFNLYVNGNAKAAADEATDVEFAVFHGAPGAPAVDVDARTVGNLVSDLSFGNFTDNYLAVPPATYYIDVKAAGDPNIVATFKADLSGLAGGAATVFASGLLGSTPAFGLFAALPDGTVVEFPVSPVARVQVIHNAPSPIVDVYANGALLLDDFEFRTATPFIFLPAETPIDIAVAPGNSTSVADAIATFDNITFENGGTYVVTAGGIVGNMDTPFTLQVNDMGREVANDGTKIELAVLHGAPNAPAVDVDAQGVGNLITNLAYGDYTSYLAVDPAEYLLDVRANGSTDVVATFRADLNGLAGNALTVFASGLLGGDPAFGLFAALADGTVVELPLVPVQATARVQIIHNSPSPTVDIYANGDLLLDNFEFRTATPFLDLPADVEIDIAVAPGNSTSVADAIATFENIVFESSKTYVVTANGIVSNMDTPFTLAVNDMAKESADDATQVEVAVFHGSPGAPAVDVDAFLVGNLVTDLAYGNYTGYLAVEPGLYFLNVRATGSPDVVATFRADLSGLAGGAATVFASGILGGDPGFGLFAALPDGTVVALPLQPTAKVQIIHNSPSPTVDVYANGALLADNFAFRTATPFINIPADTPIDIAIALENSTSVADALVTFDNLIFESNRNYVVIANGIVGNAETPFGLAVNNVAYTEGTTADQVDFNVFHGAPGAPAVDVNARMVGNLILNLAYGEFSNGYLSVPAGEYYLDVRAAGNPNIVATFYADLTGLAGGVAQVFASGILGGDPGFGLFAALPDGTVVEFPLSPVARVQIVHNAPAPTVDIYINGELAANDFAFRTATPFEYAPAETPFDIAVAPANSTSVADAIATFPNITFENNKTYIVVATGVVGDATTPFNLEIYDNAREAASIRTGVDLLLYHGAPDAPAVDVVVQGGNTLFNDIAYGEFSNYANVPAASYLLDVTPANDNSTVVDTYVAPLGTLDGGSAFVFASGFLTGNEPAFGVWVALPDGTTFPLDQLVSAKELERIVNQLRIAPNPVQENAQVRYTLTEPLDVTLRVYDMNGKLLRSTYLGNQSSGEYAYPLNVNDLPQGIYNYSLVTPQGILSKRFVVAK